MNLVELCHHRWALPILAALQQLGGGSKFVTLVNRLQISKDALSRTLQVLIELGLLERNTVYAHPLRPEYLLTEAGKPVAVAASMLLEEQPSALIFKKWSLPVLEALQHEQQFSKLLVLLAPITNRALDLALADLEQAGLFDRSEARLTGQGNELAALVTQLAAKLHS